MEQFDGALGVFLLREEVTLSVGFAVGTRPLLCKSRLFCVDLTN